MFNHIKFFAAKIEKEASHINTMEGYTETTTVIDHMTKTVFAKDGVTMAIRSVFVHRSMISEYWQNAKGKYHRECQPAVIHYEDGKIIGQWWYRNGKIHSEGDLPAIIFYKNGKIYKQHWYKDGKKHRDGQPAEIHYKDGKITKQYWYKDGKRHRKIGPVGIRICNDAVSNYWLGANGSTVDYLDVPEERRLSPEFRQATRRLPLPIGQAITHHFIEIWQFVESD